GIRHAHVMGQHPDRPSLAVALGLPSRFWAALDRRDQRVIRLLDALRQSLRSLLMVLLVDQSGILATLSPPPASRVPGSPNLRGGELLGPRPPAAWPCRHGPSTVIVACIPWRKCWRQRIWKVPGVENVKLKLPPWSRSPESQSPLNCVVVCRLM